MQKSGEARLAQWSEIDLDARLLTIPAARMKQGREHRQPLNDQAISVLKNMQALRDESDLDVPVTSKKGASRCRT